MISFPLIKYVLTAAIRDRLILSMFLLMVVGTTLSIFLGSAALIEADQFTIVFASGGLRLAGALGLVLFIVFYLRRAFDTRDIDFMLSRPVSRVTFLLSHAVAFTLLAILVAGFVILTVCLAGPQMIGDGHILWAFSLIVEYIIIVNVAMFFAMVLPNAAAGALAVFALYVLARIIGQILGIIHAGMAMAGFDVLSNVMHIVSLIVPRLDLMAQSTWLIYGPGDVGYLFILVQGVTYCTLVILAAMVDFVKRQF